MTREAAIGIVCLTALLLLYLGFSAGMIAMRPDPTPWPEVTDTSGDPITYRIVKTSTICTTAWACRFAKAHGKTTAETLEESWAD